MAKQNSTLPTVGYRDGRLTLTDPASKIPVPIESVMWFNWLQKADRFRVTARNIAYNARKEVRSNGKYYWYAYVKRGGKPFKEYLGCTENLTVNTLLDAAVKFNISIASAIGTGEITVRPPKPKKRVLSKTVYSDEPVPDAPIVAPNLTKLYTKTLACKVLGLTSAQFDFFKRELGIRHTRKIPGQYENVCYLYSAADINRMAQHIKKPTKKRAS